MVQSLATTVTEMAEGEVAQLERAGNPDATVEDYFRVIDRKTASLIAWCARVGGSRRRRRWRAPLERYGRALGRAFQIADDVLDSAIDETTAGKSVGHDLQEGKLTLPVLLACEADPALGRRIRKQLGEQGVPAAVAAEILADVRGRGRRRQGARARRARWPTRRSRALEAAAGVAATATRCARSRICRRTGAPDVARAVAATPGDGSAAGARAGAIGAPAHWEDLASFVRFLEQRGQLKRITREVDPNLEVSAIAQQVMRAGGPALLFERVDGSRFPLLINTYATRQRVSWALGVADLDEHARAILELVKSQPPTGLMDKLRMLPKLARVASATPKTVRSAPCQQVVETRRRPRRRCRSSRPGRATAGRTSRCRW